MFCIQHESALTAGSVQIGSVGCELELKSILVRLRQDGVFSISLTGVSVAKVADRTNQLKML